MCRMACTGPSRPPLRQKKLGSCQKQISLLAAGPQDAVRAAMGNAYTSAPKADSKDDEGRWAHIVGSAFEQAKEIEDRAENRW